MNFKKRLEQIEKMIKPEFDFVIVKDNEEHLKASLRGQGKIVFTESEFEKKRLANERLEKMLNLSN